MGKRSGQVMVDEIGFVSSNRFETRWLAAARIVSALAELSGMPLETRPSLHVSPRGVCGFGDGLISQEVSNFREDWMQHADQVLVDEQIADVLVRQICAHAALYRKTISAGALGREFIRHPAAERSAAASRAASARWAKPRDARSGVGA
jgi:hypothetical protein